jgi:hypothetical protein
MRHTFPILLFIASCHCATVVVTHDVPHLVRIDSNHWRSGQPKSAAGWKYLYDQGVRVDIKLDSEEEAPEADAIDAGIAVVYLPIPPHNGGDPFAGPSCQQLDQIQDAIDLYGPRGVLWHCMQGDDRTGEVSFRDCVHRRKLPVPVCEQEMKDNNYHPELLGLQRAHLECP